MRLSRTERDVLALLTSQPSLSYNDLAAMLYRDRSTVISVVRRLEARQLVAKTPGRGQLPNSYEVRNVLVSSER